MPPGKLKLEKSISHVRQVYVLLGKRYHRYPGARSRAGRRSISTLQGFPARSSFFVCLFFEPQQGACLARVSGVVGWG